MAAGNTLVAWTAKAASFPTSNAATPDTRNSRPVLDFDAATEEAICLIGVMPRHYGGGGATVHLHCTATSATSGDAKAGACVERCQVGGHDLDSDSFDSELTATATAPASSGELFLISISLAAGDLDGVMAGDLFRIKIARKAADGADTMAGDLELHAVELVEA